MASDTTEVEVKTEKVMDLTTGKFIDKPIEGNQGENEKRPIYDPTPIDETEKKIEEPTTPEPEKKPEETVTPPAENEIKFEPGSYIKEKFGEKFGLETEADLQTVLDNQDALARALEQAKLDLAKPREPEYRTDQEKKIAEFLKPFDPSKFGEGLNTVANLMAIDPASVSGRVALEEAYIINHPELTRDEAKEIFAADVWSKYQVNKDNFESDEEYEKTKRISDIKLKSEEAQARKILSETKEKLKAAEPEKKIEEKPLEVPAESVKAYTQEVEKFFNPSKDKVFDRINYSSDDGKEVLASIVFDKEKIEEIKSVMKAHLQNPNAYDKNGKIPNFAAQEFARTIARHLYGDWMDEQLWKQVKVVASKMKAEQIAGTSPEKKSGGSGDMKLSVDDQFAELAKKTAAQRKR